MLVDVDVIARGKLVTHAPHLSKRDWVIAAPLREHAPCIADIRW